MERQSLGAFLRSRRDRLTPAQAGIADYGTIRRVPGLRREELAHLAGISISYYTRLEQDQADRASEQVLDALARVLRLDATETVHLHNLARRRPLTTLIRAQREHAHPRVLALLDSLADSTPALVLGRRNDVLAWNRAGHALLTPHLDVSAPGNAAARPSLSRWFFLDPHARELHRNWDDLAKTHVAYLRLVSGRHPHDARLAELIGELTMRSRDFVALWAAGHVGDCTAGVKLLRHPTVGNLDVGYQVWLQPDSPDHRLEIYTAHDQSSSDALRLLTAGTRTPDLSDRRQRFGHSASPAAGRGG
ncbi:helix-turn-helix transcriptional regulator [Nonomuraea sp. LP-02]|uniref:helix-turn-helix transcriptional regulator n=1 Tax=Nonomuraea sp. LP-02 TaxID=3097960 RepID=UPI002E37D215|nr:helix-turn-helix transcriptional regulator [Nonomuraea sp. LP-02]MED7931179.1 helix-turn-helix transcriptional regulator [Nonomuraea sp. LP-02]